MDKSKLLKQLGRNIRAERVRQGYTQETFAELLDLHPSYVGKIERGEQNMTLGKILEISVKLNIHINELLKFN